MKNIKRAPQAQSWSVIKNPRSVKTASQLKKTKIVHRSLKPFGFEVNRIGVLLEGLMLSTGHLPSVTTSRKGVAAYGIRAGALCGTCVTIRLKD